MTVQVSAAAILKAVEEKEASLPTVNVNDRLLEQEQDLGNLLGWDENQIDTKLATDINNTQREEYLTKLARDNTQVCCIFISINFIIRHLIRILL